MDDDEDDDFSSVDEGEQSLLAAENEHLKAERAVLMQTFISLSEMIERAVIGQETEVVDDNQALVSEINLQQDMIKELMGLLPSGGDDDAAPRDAPDAKLPVVALLSEVAQEAELKVLGLLAASQTLSGGQWRRARYNASLGLPEFFSDLKLHYMLGATHLQMRFDAYFPGFSEKVVAEIVWRFFGSQEYSRRIIRSNNLTLDTLEELMLDPKTGARAKVIRFENRMTNNAVQECIMGCSKRPSRLAKSILVAPSVRQSSKAKRARTEAAHGENHSVAAAAAASTPSVLITEDDVGNQACHVVSFASTTLYPAQPREASSEFEGSFVQGAVTWSENGGCRLVVVLSYPNEYRFNGTTRLDENHVAFSPSGNVTIWLARLVEHAAQQFVTFVLEETLRRQGRDAQTADPNAVARVSELSSAASKFLQSLARPSSAPR